MNGLTMQQIPKHKRREQFENDLLAPALSGLQAP
jgi:hypothetical protein